MKVCCKNCKWRGGICYIVCKIFSILYPEGWEWCEHPSKQSIYSGTIDIPAIRKIAKNYNGECKDYCERKRWWRFGR